MRPNACACRRVAVAGLVAAQAASFAAAEAPQGIEPATARRPGLFRLGPVYLTPKLRLGTFGLDTNVFYTATDRQTDFTASVGPDLELVLPMRALSLELEGGLDYLYFARTASQRRWGGEGRARLEWARGRVAAGLERSFTRSFTRPSFEVDERVLLDQWLTIGELRVGVLGGLSLATRASRAEREVQNEGELRRRNLVASLTRDESLVVGELIQAVTPKTSLLLGGDLQLERFPRDPLRDADSNRAYAGLEVESQTRLSGRAVGGVRFYRPLAAAQGPQLHEPYADVGLSYRFGPRTALTTRFSRDLAGSAFEATSGPPVLRREVQELRLVKGLPARLDLELFGSLTRLRSLAPLRVDGPLGVQTALRNDKVWQGGADLGFRFRSHYRLGLAAAYADRRSTFEDFGLEGLLVGATLRYLP